MEDCLFCQILAKKIPAFWIFEDKEVAAFLDINPLQEGHTLIVPRFHYQDLFDIEERTLAKIILASQNISRHFQKVLGIKGVTLFQASGKTGEQSIFHFHLHLVPRKENDLLNLSAWWRTKSQKVAPEELQTIAQRLSLNQPLA